MTTAALRRLYPTLPLWVKERTWSLRPTPLHRCGDLLAFWQHKGRRRPVSWWAKQTNRSRFGKQEQPLQRICEAIAGHRDQAASREALAIFVGQNGRDWYLLDGNHRLIGCLAADFTHVIDVAVWYGVEIP